MADTLAQHAETVGDWPPSPEGLADQLRRAHEQSPDLLRLMMWEALQFGDLPVPDEGRRHAHYQAKVLALQKRFHLEDGLEASAALFALIGLAAWTKTLPQLARMLAPDGATDRFIEAERMLLHRLARAILDEKS